MRAEEVADVLGQPADHELMALFAQALRELGSLPGRAQRARPRPRRRRLRGPRSPRRSPAGMAMYDDRGFYKRAQIVRERPRAGRRRPLPRPRPPHDLRRQPRPARPARRRRPRLRPAAGRPHRRRASSCGPGRRSARSARAPCTPAQLLAARLGDDRARRSTTALWTRGGAPATRRSRATAAGPSSTDAPRAAAAHRARRGRRRPLARGARGRRRRAPLRPDGALGRRRRDPRLGAGAGRRGGRRPVRPARRPARGRARRGPGPRRRRRLGRAGWASAWRGAWSACPPPPPRPVPLPDADLAFYDHVLRLDPDGRWWFEALWTPSATRRWRRAWRSCARAWPRWPRRAAGRRAGPVRAARPGAAGHRAAVAACRRAHRRRRPLPGQPLPAPGRGAGTGAAADALRRAPPARCARPRRVRRGPWGAVVTLSPELFLERRGRDACRPRRSRAPRRGGRPRRGAGRARPRTAPRTS